MKNMNKRRKILAGILSPLLAIVICLGVILPSIFVWKENKESIPATSPSVEEGSKWSERVLAVAETGDVTLDADITGASSADASLKGGAIVLENRATFTMTGGTVSGHERVYGGAIFIGNGATFTMNGGEISGNKAKYGGAIYVANGGHCIINGGKITANKSEVGPAIYVESGGNLEVGAGAEIVDNIQEPYDQNTPAEPVAPEGYMYFGEYPKTIKASNVTISGDPDAKGYYTGSDGAKYAKVVVGETAANNAELTADIFSNGESIIKDKEVYFKVEKLLWRILEQKDGSALLVTDNAIDSIVWQVNSSLGNNYKNSSIRTWLNNDFYNKSFSDTEKSKILFTEVDNSLASTLENENPYICENTNDKVFLLSIADLCNANYGFNADKANLDVKRKFDNSDYAKANGALTITETFINSLAETEADKLLIAPYIGSGVSWLRSPAVNGSDSVCALLTGAVSDGFNATQVDKNVVCALKVSLSNEPVDPGEDITANIYVDGEVEGPFTVNSLTKLKNLKDVDIGEATLSIIDEQSCGLFLNEGLTISVDNYEEMTVKEAIDQLQSSDSKTGEKSLKLYTKIATPEKLSFTLTSDNTYSVKASEMTITGTVVIPRKYNGKLVDRVFEIDATMEDIMSGEVTPDGAFMCCAGVTEIYLPSSITSIGNAFVANFTEASSYAFQKVNMHDRITRIGIGAFYLTQITDAFNFPESLTYIGEMAYAQCMGISGELKIPKNVSKIGSGAFMIVPGISDVSVDPQNTAYTSRDKAGNEIHALIEIASKKLMIGTTTASLTNDGSITSIEPCACILKQGIVGEVRIPDGVELIADMTFTGCENITSLIIPEGVTYIESSAFDGCTSLVSVSFPSTLKNISLYAFCNCSALQNVDLSHVERIGGDAFRDCSSLVNVIFGDNLNLIEANAFGGCTSLSKVFVPSTVSIIESGSFSTTTEIYTDVEDASKKPSGWEENSITIHYGYTENQFRQEFNL